MTVGAKAPDARTAAPPAGGARPAGTARGMAATQQVQDLPELQVEGAKELGKERMMHQAGRRMEANARPETIDEAQATRLAVANIAKALEAKVETPTRKWTVSIGCMGTVVQARTPREALAVAFSEPRSALLLDTDPCGEYGIRVEES